jgi:polyhydroxybutyrate depolymerase
MVTYPILSTGCGKPAPFSPGLSKNETLKSGGFVRLYRLHLPSGYRNNMPQPLVLNFHGHGSTAAHQEQLTQLSLLADQQHFIAAYPQGMVGPDHATGWATGPVHYPHVNDVLFVNDLLNSLQSRLCIDPARIYAMGFSNGGGMVNLLAARLSGRIAAFASVSGSYYPVSGGYHVVRPVSLLEIHGTGDQVVPYNGSKSKDYAPVTKWLLSWVQRDHCNNRPDAFLKQQTILGEQWQGCKDGAAIIHYRILHEGHIWPHVLFAEQVQKQWHHVTATNLIWQFFEQHPMTALQASDMRLSKPAVTSDWALPLHSLQIIDRLNGYIPAKEGL